MSDAALKTLAAEALDGTRFASMIRRSVNEVVEGTLAKVPGNVGTREHIRAAGERLGDALVAHADAAKHPARRAQRGTLDARALPAGDSDERARAFRTMAGVRR